MYWSYTQLNHWRFFLLDGVFTRDPILTTRTGRPRRLSAAQVWDYLEHRGLLDEKEREAFAEEQRARREIQLLWEAVVLAFADHRAGRAINMFLPEGWLMVYDFRPSASIYDYFNVPREQQRTIATLKSPDAYLALEPTGALQVEYQGHTYTDQLPVDLIEHLKSGELEPSLAPWFVVRLLVNDEPIDDIWIDDSLPGSLVGLKELMRASLREAHEREVRIHAS